MKRLEETIRSIGKPSVEWREKARKHILNLTMPPWALGRLLDLAVDLAGMQETLELRVRRKNIVLMAGDHGIVDEGVSPCTREVTTQMIHNFVGGNAGINVLARNAGANVTVVDLGVESDLSGLGDKILHRKVRNGTRNFARGPAMTREEAVMSLENGIGVALALAPETDVFGTGDMGIGNTSPSSAIISILSGQPLSPLVGAGAGLTPDKVARKARIIEQGIRLNVPDRNNPLDVLAKVGGLEIGGIAGLILGAASLRRPVVVDGFISTAGALIAASLAPESAHYMILAHRSAEPGHPAMTDILGKTPLLDLGMRLGEGTGAALSMHLLDAAAAILKEMATFQSANVSRGDMP